MNKYFVAGMLAFGLLLAASTIAVGEFSRSSATRLQEAALERVGKELESRFFFRHSDELKWLASQSSVRQFLSSTGGSVSPSDDLLKQTAGVLNLDAVYLIDVHGRIVASSDSTFLGADVSSRRYFREAMASRPAYDMAIGLVTKTRGVYAAVPVLNGNSVVGVAAFRTPSTQIDGFLAQDTGLALVDSSGVVYSASDKSMIGSLEALSSQERRLIQDRWHRIARFKMATVEGAELLSFVPESWPWALWFAVEILIVLSGLFGLLAIRQSRLSRSRKDDDRDRHQREVLLANLLEGIAILDKSGQVIWSNPAFTRLAQIDSLPGTTTMAELWDRPEPAPWREVMEGRREWVVFESILQGRKGAWTPVLAGFTSAEGQYLLSVLDWSERYQSDQLLRQTQKLTVLGQLSGGIAHDLNNMLGVLMGMADLIKMSLADNDPLHESTDLMQTTLTRAAALAEKMLDFARQTPIQRRPFDVSGLLRELRFLAKSALPASTEAVVVMPAGVVLVNGDENLLLSALLNLVLNGAEAQPEGGIVKVEGLRVAPGMFAISVSDHGVGMDKETQARIFEPFFSTKFDKKGTGLGLSLVRRTILEHRGTIEVHSKVGEGTTITVTLPTEETIGLPVRG